MIVTLIIAFLLAPLTVLTICFAVELFAGLKPLRRQVTSASPNAQAVIVVAAHNEEDVLRGTLEQLKAAAGKQTRILVVADNCTDSTADIARALGADVIERSDIERRGKGFALDFARRHLMDAPPDVVLIVDADCTIDGRSVAALIQACGATSCPCQATNLQRSHLSASPSVQLSTFAFFIKNVIRQRALERLAGRAHLLGTGMALPWPLFAEAKLATSNIVEDLKLGQDLADAGHAPIFVEAATVWSNAETERNTLSQRSRWEGGFLQNALYAGPQMLARSVLEADFRGIWAAINTMIPPFTLLILTDIAAVLIFGGVEVIIHARIWPVLALGSALLAALTGLASAWCAGGSRFVSLRALMRAPFYIAWKVPMYVAFARRGAPKEWQRTDRR